MNDYFWSLMSASDLFFKVEEEAFIFCLTYDNPRITKDRHFPSCHRPLAPSATRCRLEIPWHDWSQLVSLVTHVISSYTQKRFRRRWMRDHLPELGLFWFLVRKDFTFYLRCLCLACGHLSLLADIITPGLISVSLMGFITSDGTDYVSVREF